MGFLTGKTALITGAGRAVLQDGSCGSIGYGIATAYAKEGANLVSFGYGPLRAASETEATTRLCDGRVGCRLYRTGSSSERTIKLITLFYIL